jgi:hypothetical protein
VSRERGADSRGVGADGSAGMMLRSGSLVAVLVAVQTLGTAAFASPGVTGLPSLRRGPVLAALMADAQGVAAGRPPATPSALSVGTVLPLGEPSGLGGELIHSSPSTPS